MSVEELTQANADTITTELTRSALMLVMTKDSLPVELAFRVVFDGAAVVGVKGLPTGEQAYGNYFQGIGPLLLAPKNWKQTNSPNFQVKIVAHECTHGGQFYSDPLHMPSWYVQHTEARAVYESEAFGTGFELHFAFTGELPEKLEDLAHAEREGYALKSGDLELVTGMSEQRVTSVSKGVIVTVMGRKAIRRIWQLQPNALHPDAVAKIMVGSPGLLS